MKKKTIGVCHICGQTKELTFEHLPPRSTGNKGIVKSYDHDDLVNIVSFKVVINLPQFVVIVIITLGLTM